MGSHNATHGSHNATRGSYSATMLWLDGIPVSRDPLQIDRWMCCSGMGTTASLQNRHRP